MSELYYTNSYDQDFDAMEGLTESPDVDAARGALLESQTGPLRTEEAIADSQSVIAELRAIREENHFTQKLRRIIRAQPPRSI